MLRFIQGFAAAAALLIGGTFVMQGREAAQADDCHGIGGVPQEGVGGVQPEGVGGTAPEGIGGAQPDGVGGR